MLARNMHHTGDEDEVLPAELLPEFSDALFLQQNQSLPELAHSLFEDNEQTRTPPRVLFSLRTHAAQVESEHVVQALNEIIDAEFEITGKLLKKLREHIKLELTEIAENTRIPLHHLRAIEDDILEESPPAPVYYRGYVEAYLRYLRLNRKDVVKVLAERYKKKF